MKTIKDATDAMIGVDAEDLKKADELLCALCDVVSQRLPLDANTVWRAALALLIMVIKEFDDPNAAVQLAIKALKERWPRHVKPMQ
jgi:hypothetical protein